MSSLLPNNKYGYKYSLCLSSVRYTLSTTPYFSQYSILRNTQLFNYLLLHEAQPKWGWGVVQSGQTPLLDIKDLPQSGVT